MTGQDGADMTGHELPASVRVALWGTAVLGGRLPSEELARRALPDVDACAGLVEAFELWAALGEQVALAALPRPGDFSGMPRAGSEAVDAATLAQECALVPGVGGLLVPQISSFGPVGDQGWSATWTAYPADPVPTHRIEALDLGQVELLLRTELAELTEELARTGSAPFGGAARDGLARARAGRGTRDALLHARGGTGDWGLPEGLPPRALRVIDLAGTVLRLTDVGLDTVTASVDAASVTGRTRVLRRLAARATSALADATNVAALHLAFRT